MTTIPVSLTCPQVRSRLGPASYQLLAAIADGQAIETRLSQTGRDPRDVRADAKALNRVITTAQQRLHRARTSVKTLIDQWDNSILALSLDDRPPEKALFKGRVEGEDGYQAKLDEAEAVERNLDEVSQQVNKLIRDLDETLSEHLADLTLDAGSAAITTAVAPAPSVPEIHVQLPILQLQQFNGNPEEWPAFWTAFENAVDAQPIPLGRKLAYLKSLLRGAALSAVKGFSVVDANYRTIVSLLQARFGDATLLRQSLHHQLNNLPRASNNVTAIRNLHNEAARIYRLLKQVGDNPEHQLVQIAIEQKLPTSWIAKITIARLNDAAWSVAKTLAIIDAQLKVEEYVATTTSSLNDEHHDNRRPRQDQNQRTRHFGPPTQRQQTFATNNQEGKCAFCQDKHYSSECLKVQTPEQRSQKARDLKLCYQCLSPTHNSKDCKTRKTCYYCQQHHHSALCPSGNSGTRFPQPLMYNRLNNRNPTNQRTFNAKAQTPVCALCNKDHYSSNCQMYSTPLARKNRAIQLSKCTRCLKIGHKTTQCKTTFACYQCKQKDHHSALCPRPQTKEPTQNNDWELGNMVNVTNSTLLPVVRVNVSNPNNSTITPQMVDMFLDNGSTASYITTKLVTKLKLKPIEETTCHVQTFGGDVCTLETERYKLTAVTPDGNSLDFILTRIDVINDQIPTGIVDHYEPNGPTNWTATQTNPAVLVGNDYSVLLRTSRLVSGHTLWHTKLGPIVHGAPNHHSLSITHTEQTKKQHSEPIVFSPPKFNDHEKLNFEWNLETYGLNDALQVDEESALQYFQNTLKKLPSGRYEASWPWKEVAPLKSTHYNLSLGRLDSVWKKMSSDPTRLLRYDKIIRDQIQEGILEEAPDSSTPGYTRYLPHHGVFRADKNKLRIVHDASANLRSDDSLNRYLHRGPTLISNLVGVLLKARMSQIIVFADVKAAFLNIGLNPNDRDSVRFLWLRDPLQRPTSANVWPLRFTRIPFGIISSPFILNATILHHLSQYKSPLAEELKTAMYVDNVVIGANDPSDAIRKTTETIKIFRDAQLELHEITSNNPTVNAQFGAEFKYNNQNLPTANFFGLVWLIQSDEILIKRPTFIPNDPLTKRKISRHYSSIYDPFGFASPSTLESKHLFHRVSHAKSESQDVISSTKPTKKYSWDTPIDDPILLSAWKDSLIDNDGLSLSFKRKVPLNLNKPVSIHVFSDASERAFGITIYLVQDNLSTLLMAKSLITPWEKLTIPKLELVAATLACKLSSFVQTQMKSLDIKEVVHWIDSRCVLAWIQTPTLEGVLRFVANRLEVLRNAPKTEYRFVPTSLNPADIPTRGMNLAALQLSVLWWNGPPFLQQDRSAWPRKSSVDPAPEYVMSIISPLITTSNKNPPHWITNVAQRVSKWQILIGVIRTVLLFIIRSASNIQLSAKFEDYKANTSFSDKTIIDMIVAAASYDHPPSATTIEQFGIAEDNGIYSLTTRLRNSSLPETAVNPRYLPRQHPITRLLILFLHEQRLHCGRDATVSAVRTYFWIPALHSTVKSALFHCTRCKRLKARPFARPLMPPLPAERSQVAPAFHHIGIDYLGPLATKFNNETAKRWILLITCLVTRACHLELTIDISAEATTRALQRFVARRGMPTKVWSDNAPQFLLVSRLWKDQVKWNTILPHSPWMGGFYERMVGTFKKSYVAALGRKIPTHDDLQTIMTEIEMIINTRPLYSTEDNCVRPIDLIQPNFKLPKLEAFFETEEIYLPPDATSADKLADRLKRNSDIRSAFWNVWSNFYLLELRQHHKLLHSKIYRSHSRSPEIGELVIVQNENTAPANWKMALILSVHKSNDGEIRGATIKMPNGRITIRPLSLLSPLEIRSTTIKPTETTIESEEQLISPTQLCEQNKVSEGSFPPKPEERTEENRQLKITTPVQNSSLKHTAEARTSQRQTKISHQYNLRTRKQLVYFILSSIFIFQHALAFHTSHWAPTCEAKHDHRPVFADSCGTIITAVFQTSNRTLCSEHHVCTDTPGNVVRVTLNPNERFSFNCIPNCDCKQEQIECTPTPVPPTDRLNDTIMFNLSTIAPTYCSTVPDARCDSKAIPRTAHQIWFEDGSTTYVRNLNVKHVQKWTRCVGQGLLTGSMTFCANNHCHRHGTRYCDTPLYSRLVFIFEDLEIPITAYATVELTTYNYKPKIRHNPAIEIACRKSGIIITSEETTDLYEISIRTKHYHIENPAKSETLMITTDVSASPHDINLTAWREGRRVATTFKHCPANAFCEDIRCTFCMELLHNLQCAPSARRLIEAVALFLILTVVLMIISFLSLAFRLIRYPFRLLWKATKMGRNKAIRSRFPSTQQHRQRTSYSNRKSLILLLAGLATQASACTHTTVLTAKAERCDNDVCQVEHDALATLRIYERLCLQFVSPNGLSQQTTEIEFLGIQSNCVPITDYFTYSFRVATFAVHRCAMAGTCSVNNCQDIHTDTQIPEFGSIVNQSPGHSHCTSSCSGLLCGCLLPTPSCLFYKIYAERLDPQPHTVFHCLEWKERAIISITTTNHYKTSTHQAFVSPGDPTNVEGVRIQLANLQSPIFPSSPQFLQTSDAIYKYRETPPMRLECADPKTYSACQFTHNCICDTRNDHVNCDCPVRNITEPLPNTFYDINNLTLSRRIDSSTGEFSLGIKSKFRILTTNTSCKAAIGKLQGCSQCIPGALLPFTCHSSSRVLAKITCPSIDFTAPCDNTTSSIRLHLPATSINEMCEVKCPGSKQSLIMTGILSGPPLSFSTLSVHFVHGFFNAPNVAAVMQRTIKYLFHPSFIIVAILAILTALVIIRATFPISPLFKLVTKRE